VSIQAALQRLGKFKLVRACVTRGRFVPVHLYPRVQAVCLLLHSYVRRVFRGDLARLVLAFSLVQAYQACVLPLSDWKLVTHVGSVPCKLQLVPPLRSL
jgi:hypothetical protein